MTVTDQHGNAIAQEGCDRCFCGCKYWEKDRCVDCGTPITALIHKIEAYKDMSGPQSNTLRYWSFYVYAANGECVASDNGYGTKREALAAGQQAADFRGLKVGA